jgi:hypothetical protein
METDTALPQAELERSDRRPSPRLEIFPSVPGFSNKIR